MWLCVLYSPPLILHWQLAFASPRSHFCMNVTEYFVFPSLLLSLQIAVSRHFGILGVPKWATTSSKRSKNTCFSVAHGLGSFLRKVIFLPLLDPVDPFGHPPVWASACSLPQPSGPRYGGLDVPLGNSEGWKPQKVGGCGWNRCPRNRILSHVAKDMAYSWFVAVGIWSFWGPF